MNILHLADHYPDYPGNFGNMLIKLSESGRKRNYNLIFVFPKKREWHKDLIKGKNKVVYCEVRKKTDISSFRYLRRIVREENIDVIHTHFGLEHNLMSIYLKLLCKMKLKLVWDWRGHPARPNMWKILVGTPVYRLLNDFVVKAHISNSKYITDKLTDYNLISKNTKIYTIQNSVDIEYFKKDIYDEEICKLSKQYRNDINFIVLMVRNFRSEVDFNIILDVMENLKEYEDIKLVWVGYGEKETEIKESAIRRKLYNIVFTGKVDNVVPYYYMSNISINAYEPWCNETINNTVYESLACGKPVVGLNFGGLPNIFNCEDGVLLSSLDSKEYSDVILTIKNNYEYYSNKAIIGKTKVQNNYSIDVYTDRILSVYENIITS